MTLPAAALYPSLKPSRPLRKNYEEGKKVILPEDLCPEGSKASFLC